ncbi:interleukin-17 receptor E-like protein [Genypterus blacodes]|uniref:interleukin-17 receptor E-like protein n=1 Tax=Genypterus blacodes TaxID=154954 RepID=UPI003F777390
MRMILLVTVSVSLCWILNGAAAQSTTEKCGTQCSQGLQCKSKPGYLFPPPCQTPPEGLLSSSVFHNVSLYTVMTCEGRQKCSLRLRISTKLQLSESIHGVSISIMGAGITRSHILSFTRASREKMSGRKVQVDDCVDISPGEEVLVTVNTFPSYCGITWTGTYRAPECSSGDLRKHVPECITGRLSYEVDQERKELRVGVSDMLDNNDYHLRLCRKDFFCMGMGQHKLIKKEEPVKNATLPFTRPLPCLCIEGFSAMTDAPRVQVCPFKDRMEELWLGVTFDPAEETLLWEPACRVAATVALCQRGADGSCAELPHSSRNVSREKIAFTKVDPHPQLCMKFTAGSRSWIKCPFADSRFQAWEMRRQGHQEVHMRSQITASFSVGVCVKSGPSHVCGPEHTHTVHVEKHKSVQLDLTEDLCKSHTCLQVRRTDVKYATTVVQCFQQCDQSASWEVAHVIVPVGVCLFTIIFVTLVLHLLLTVYHKRNLKRKMSRRIADKETGLVPDCVVQALHREKLTPLPLQFGNFEKTNLLS